MPASTITSVLGFVETYWAALMAFIGMVFGYGRLNQKVESQGKRIDTLEHHLSETLSHIREDVKDVSNKVDEQKSTHHQMHIDILEKLSSGK